MIVRLDAKQFTYSPNCKKLVSEASTLGLRTAPRVVLLADADGDTEFRFTSKDIQHGESVGFNYKAVDSGDNMLIIND